MDGLEAVAVVRILGIDPSLTGCGLALVEDGVLGWYGAIRTPATDSRGTRLRAIHAGVKAAYIGGQPDVVAMEGYAAGAKFGREAMGEVGGVIKLLLAYRGVEPVIWQNTSWKKTLLGNGGLKKDGVRLEIFKRYGVELKDDNELEAYAVAMAEWLAFSGAPRPRPKAPRKPKPAPLLEVGR